MFNFTNLRNIEQRVDQLIDETTQFKNENPGVFQGKGPSYLATYYSERITELSKDTETIQFELARIVEVLKAIPSTTPGMDTAQETANRIAAKVLGLYREMTS